MKTLITIIIFILLATLSEAKPKHPRKLSQKEQAYEVARLAAKFERRNTRKENQKIILITLVVVLTADLQRDEVSRLWHKWRD